MNHASIRRWALRSVAALLLGAPAVQAQAPAPIYTRNTSLRLPVTLDERSRSEVAEIRLHARGPDGKWQLINSVAASHTSLDFRAPSDGEYHFVFVTVDRKGVAYPAKVDGMVPHRVVIIDSTPPDVSVRPVPIRGEQALQCQIRDASPDVATLKLEYQAADQTWRALQTYAADQPTLFRIPNTGVLEGRIRVSVADRVGNKTVREIDLGDPTSPLGLPTPPSVDRGKPDPTTFPKLEAEPIVGARPAVEQAGFPGVKTPSPTPPMVDLTLPPDLGTAKPPIPDISVPDLVTPPPVPPTKPSDVKVPEVKVPAPEVKVPEIATPDVKVPELGNVKMPSPPKLPPPAMPDVRTPKVPDVEVPPIPGESTSLKPTTTPRVEPSIAASSHPVLSTRTCVINYEADGLSKVGARIDFWATRDGGKTWEALRDEAGGIAPARLTLPSDGVFGIRIRPGAGNKPPESGEEPDCFVEVDTTKPAVNLLKPVVGNGSEEGVMLLTWTAADKNLLVNSIALYYATKADGPWEVIAKGHKNDGVYRWAMPTGLAGDVYVRVEASDRAGNVGRHDLMVPVALDSSKARVRVINVGPAK